MSQHNVINDLFILSLSTYIYIYIYQYITGEFRSRNFDILSSITIVGLDGIKRNKYTHGLSLYWGFENTHYDKA